MGVMTLHLFVIQIVMFLRLITGNKRIKLLRDKIGG